MSAEASKQFLTNLFQNKADYFFARNRNERFL